MKLKKGLAFSAAFMAIAVCLKLVSQLQPRVRRWPLRKN